MKRLLGVPPLSRALESSAEILVGEQFWDAADAKDVIALLCKSGIAVTGVELFTNSNGAPKWLASSEYEIDSGDWHEFVVRCAGEASSFVEDASTQPGAIFCVAWRDSPRELAGPFVSIRADE